MSVDFNSLMRNAFNNAETRKKNMAALHAGIYNKGIDIDDKKTELSMEDIAAAMREKRLADEEQDRYLTKRADIIGLFDKEKSEANKVAAELIPKVNEQALAIHQTTEIALSRQEQIAKSMRNKDPFAK